MKIIWILEYFLGGSMDGIVDPTVVTVAKENKTEVQLFFSHEIEIEL